MPPDHGAAVVRVILDDRELARDWIAELDEVRTRLAHIRAALAKTHPRLAPVGEQRGMFSLLPISAETVLSLREGQGIYMAGNGRINVAGLNADTLPRFVDTLTACLG
jgi:aromatic-amino-acid transaminase